MPSTALFVIDIQMDLAGDPDTRIPAAERIYSSSVAILKRARADIAAARERGEEPPLSIVFVQHEETSEEGMLVKGTRPWELVFNPIEEDAAERVVGKTVRDTFESNPYLAEQLRADGINQIVAFGIQSECCVLSTCLAAIDSGFKVTLLKGAHSTFDSSSRTAEEFEQGVEDELEGKGAAIVPWKDWIEG